jgi:hypothetical protein
MNKTTGSLFVIGLSLSVFLFSALCMDIVWDTTGFLEGLPRGIVALFAWIFSFAFASFLFWKTIIRVSVPSV